MFARSLMPVRVTALVVALAVANAPRAALSQPQRGADPRATIAAVRAYFEQELPIGWRGRGGQIAPRGEGAHSYLEAPFLTTGDKQRAGAGGCPRTPSIPLRPVLFPGGSRTRPGR